MEIELICPTCRQPLSPAASAWGCPQAGDGKEHILQKVVKELALDQSDVQKDWQQTRDAFYTFRKLLGSHSLLLDEQFCEILQSQQANLEQYEQRRFVGTPLRKSDQLAASIGQTGQIWLKDETNNVTGSHKGRHLFGTLLYLESWRAKHHRSDKSVLAIYSCGNAALGAAAVARAGGYELHTYVPAELDPVVDAMLEERGALVEKVSRDCIGEGDPCYLAFKQALSKGWLPFACSGTDNWSNIEGGETLAWEMIMQLKEQQANVDHLAMQVGGGALARAISQGWQELYQAGVVDYLPRFHACQPEGGFPFVRAYHLVLAHLAQMTGLEYDLSDDSSLEPGLQIERLKLFIREHEEQIQAASSYAREHFDSAIMTECLSFVRENRSDFMWAWDGEAPYSLAHGILDDETYDWYPLLLMMLKTGGRAVIINEPVIKQAYEIGQSKTGIQVAPTGSAGLAGLLVLQGLGVVRPEDSVGLFFTGIERIQ